MKLFLQMEQILYKFCSYIKRRTLFYLIAQKNYKNLLVIIQIFGKKQMKNDLFQKLKLIQKNAKNFTNNQSSGANIFGNNFNNVNPGIKPLMDMLNQQSKRNEEAFKQAYNKYSKKLTQSIKQVNNPVKDIKNPFKDIKNCLNNVNNQFKDIKNPLNDIKNPLKDVSKPLNDIKNRLFSIKASDLNLSQKLPQNMSIQSLKSKLSSLKDSTLSHSQSIKQQIVKSSQKIKTQSNRIYEQTKQNFNIEKKIKKGFNFVFWRFTFFVAALTFAYAVGTTIPKEVIRSLFNQNMSQSHHDDSKASFIHQNNIKKQQN